MSPFSLIDIARLNRRAHPQTTYSTLLARDVADVVTYDPLGGTNELRSKMTAMVGTMFALSLLISAALAVVFFLLD
ncbi:hypothetical protein [Paraburkholderia sp. C35]|uniref:hypothetical protein n=1 Tax=Paraburkholderia sp. C35 TaxID=2126993 RepID=UPI000D68E400|nr:hypothetical protein [Paraburkholderia sp. C35]